MVKRAIRRARIKVARTAIKVAKPLMPKCKHKLDMVSYDKKKKATILECPVCGAKKEIPDEHSRKREKKQKKKH